jgi:hypothetical protein
MKSSLEQGSQSSAPVSAVKSESSSSNFLKYLKKIVIRVLFPPILLKDLLSSLISKVVLPAQSRKWAKISEIIFGNKLGKATINGQRVTQFVVKSSDGVVLATIKIEPKVENAEYSDKYIINFVGNGMFYEDIIQEMVDDASELQCNVIGFNFRGVNKSTGRARSKDDLVADGIAQVQKVLNEGIFPANILLKGHSLGAGVATLVAKHFLNKNIKINLFNDRSFSTLTDATLGMLSNDDAKYPTNYKDSQVTKKGGIIRSIVRFFLSITNWEIDAAEAFKELHTDNKAYLLVKPTKQGILHLARMRGKKLMATNTEIAESLKIEADKITKKITALNERLNSLLTQFQEKLNELEKKDENLSNARKTYSTEDWEILPSDEKDPIKLNKITTATFLDDEIKKLEENLELFYKQLGEENTAAEFKGIEKLVIKKSKEVSDELKRLNGILVTSIRSCAIKTVAGEEMPPNAYQVLSEHIKQCLSPEARANTFRDNLNQVSNEYLRIKADREESDNLKLKNNVAEIEKLDHVVEELEKKTVGISEIKEQLKNQKPDPSSTRENLIMKLNALNKEFKDMVSKEKIQSPADGVIAHEASLHSKLKNEILELDSLIKIFNIQNQLYPHNKNAILKEIKHLQLRKQNLMDDTKKAFKMTISAETPHQGHNVPLTDLTEIKDIKSPTSSESPAAPFRQAFFKFFPTATKVTVSEAQETAELTIISPQSSIECNF